LTEEKSQKFQTQSGNQEVPVEEKIIVDTSQLHMGPVEFPEKPYEIDKLLLIPEVIHLLDMVTISDLERFGKAEVILATFLLLYVEAGHLNSLGCFGGIKRF
jgi:hypothetical protein